MVEGDEKLTAAENGATGAIGRYFQEDVEALNKKEITMNYQKPNSDKNSNGGNPPSAERGNGKQISSDTRSNFGRRGGVGNLPQGDLGDRSMPARVVPNRNVEKESY